ncbi:MAG: ADP-forming succinate--CoA ligase subunit beta [Spirochaetales bacterium]|nr:ADP-forming succinate--CoA ligase subunit beta [Spirochaetales bacterium]
MKLHEHQTRHLFRKVGIPLNDYRLVHHPSEAGEAAAQWETTVVKAQVLTGGRGKAGGVKLAQGSVEATEKAQDILGLEIKGHKVKALLVCDAAPIEKEHYLGFIVDRSRRAITLMLSAEGGMDIEELAATKPQAIHTLSVVPGESLDSAALEALLNQVFPFPEHQNQAKDTIEKLYNLFMDSDASLLEINPYALTPDGRLLALDGKMVLDDNALHRHPDLMALRNPEEERDDEREAREKNLSFVSLDGSIGCVVNGAGLAMATLDLIKHYGGTPANFLDVGGSSNPQKVTDALSIILRNPQVNALLINIFGGITRCDDIARGLLMAQKELEINVPLVIRLVGTNQEEGRAILEEAGITAGDDLDEAVKAVIAASRSQA